MTTNIKLIIFGSKGWIGNQFINYLNEVENNNENFKYIEANIRADNEKDVEELILKEKPTHIISFIGRTHGKNINSVEYLEQEGKLKENIRDNLYGPMVLSILSNKYNIHYTYLGTGCLFSQEDPSTKSYKESDEPDFFGSSYSTVKGFTERLLNFSDSTLVLRIRMPIVDFHHSRNIITKLTIYKKIWSVPNSMTILHDFYPIILDLIKRKEVGILNLVNPGLISHNEILEMYKEIIDPSIEWNNCNEDELLTECRSKKSNNHLDTSKLESLYPSISNIKDSVRSCLLRMKSKQT